MRNIEKAIKKIETDGVDEIVKIAINNFIEGYASIVYYDPDTDSFSGETCSSGRRLNPNPKSRLEEVYRLDRDWIVYNEWETSDILTDGEYEDLKKAVARDEGLTDEYDIEYATDFLDSGQLALIGISLYERLEEYLHDCEMETRIIEELKGQDQKRRRKCQYIIKKQT